MVYLENPPDYTQLNEEFAWEKTFKKERERRSTEEAATQWISQKLRRIRKCFKRSGDRICRLICEQAENLPLVNGQINVVDAGCGYGDKIAKVATHLQSRGFNAIPIGIDISRQLAASANKDLSMLGGRCIEAPTIEGLEQIPCGTLSAVMLRSYLEHEINPLPVLRTIRSRLAPGGLVFIKVPNFGCINRIVRQRKWCGFRYPDHVNYFTPATLKAIVTKSGLTVHRMNWADRFPFSDNMYLIARAD